MVTVTRTVGTLYEQARALLHARRVFLFDTPRENWAPIGPMILAAILDDEECAALSPVMRHGIATEQRAMFGENDDFSRRGAVAASPAADDDGDDDEDAPRTTRAKTGHNKATHVNPSAGGRAPGRHIMANGRVA